MLQILQVMTYINYNMYTNYYFSDVPTYSTCIKKKLIFYVCIVNQKIIPPQFFGYDSCVLEKLMRTSKYYFFKVIAD